jgi:hypothetical protein
VRVNQAQVRSGAGLKHRVVTSLNRESPVEVQSRLGDWLKIAAPTGVMFWVSSARVAMHEAEPEPVDAPMEPEPPAIEIPVEAPPPLRGFRLAVDVAQGEAVRMAGRLDWSSQWRRELPVSFELLAPGSPEHQIPACRVIASAAMHESLIGCEVVVTGTRWILADDPAPVLMASGIETPVELD